MFTGLITGIGTLAKREKTADTNTRFHIIAPDDWDCASIPMGASIACSGVCLTVIATDADSFAVDVSAETLAVTTLGLWQPGTAINLERSLKLGDEMGGHIVSGHVDGVAQLASLEKDGTGHRMFFDAPDGIAHLIAPKGSVALDGVSLTVNEVSGNRFGIMVIPHTWQHTTLGQRKPGDMINLEADMLARYVARITGRETP